MVYYKTATDRSIHGMPRYLIRSEPSNFSLVHSVSQVPDMMQNARSRLRDTVTRTMPVDGGIWLRMLTIYVEGSERWVGATDRCRAS